MSGISAPYIENVRVSNFVTDQEVLDPYRILASGEDIFCEPASAASVAELLKFKDKIPDNATVVCVLTGNGLKDPSSAIDHSLNALKQGVPLNLEKVAKFSGILNLV